MTKRMVDYDQLKKALSDFHGLALRDGDKNIADGIRVTINYIEILYDMKYSIGAYQEESEE